MELILKGNQPDSKEICELATRFLKTFRILLIDRDIRNFVERKSDFDKAFSESKYLRTYPW